MDRRARVGTAAGWLAVAAATVAATVAIDAAGLPTATLFGALAAGIAYALVVGGRRPLDVPPFGMTFGQAVLGVALGTEMQASTLRAVASDWLGVTVVTAGTLVASLVAGLLIARATGIGRPTGALGLVAGGASGIVAMADELGADARLVAFMQYLRVLVVVLVAPLVAYAVLEHGDTVATLPDEPGASTGLATALVFTAGCAVAGTLAARVFRITAGSLLGPLVLAAALSTTGLVENVHVPDALQHLAFAIIGLQVGLRFTAATIVEAGRLLPWALAAIAALIVACAGLAALLVPLADVTFADAYLATTPGGLYAVLAASIGIGANTTFVVSVQILRLFVIILAAPPLVAAITRGAKPVEAAAVSPATED